MLITRCKPFFEAKAKNATQVREEKENESVGRSVGALCTIVDSQCSLLEANLTLRCHRQTLPSVSFARCCTQRT